VVIFEGRTRSTPGTPAPGEEAEAARHAGRAVESLEYEALDSLVRRTWEAIADEVEDRFGVRRLAIVHRTGDVPLGETSIIVVAAAPHREAAFAAARHAMNETKARVPIWKAERFADGHVWIGEPARTAGPEESAR
jgi:molybdopterin synthase catalytic subunit